MTHIDYQLSSQILVFPDELSVIEIIDKCSTNCMYALVKITSLDIFEVLIVCLNNHITVLPLFVTTMCFGLTHEKNTLSMILSKYDILLILKKWRYGSLL